MKIQLFSGVLYLGSTNAEIIDASMGVVGGRFNPSLVYLNQFQSLFRRHMNAPDWRNIEKLNLWACTAIGEKLEAKGGFCLTDIADEATITIEICGIEYVWIDRISRRK